MKILIAITLMIGLTSNTTPFAEGWTDGYVDGYCQNIQYCTTPWIPVCPYPKAYETTYKDGYNRGFIKGNDDRADR